MSTGANNLSHVHKELINLLITIDRICRENNIKYALHGGTLLGAERNGKLIPWDEDADISMHRSEFEKMQAIQKNLPYKIEASELAPWLTSFCMYNTDGSKTSIDVFIWDYISESKKLQAVKINVLRLIQGMMKKNIDYSEYTVIQKILVFITHLFGLPFSENMKRKMYNKVSRDVLIGNRTFIHRSNDAYVGVSYVFDAEYMNSYTDIKLEGSLFMVPKRYKEFLVRNYGKDYMTPPKEKDRKAEHGHDKAFLPESERGGLFSVRR